MPRGGKRTGAGRRKNSPELPAGSPTKNLASEILASLGDADYKCKCLNATCEKCLWRQYALRDRSALEYLWNRRDGKPVHNINHMHDKPIEMNVNLKFSEIIRQVRERKREYERTR